jgi:hypothetical protein
MEIKELQKQKKENLIIMIKSLFEERQMLVNKIKDLERRFKYRNSENGKM